MKLIYELRSKGMKEPVNKKRLTVGAHCYANRLLKNTSAKREQYVVNLELSNLAIFRRSTSAILFTKQNQYQLVQLVF